VKYQFVPLICAAMILNTKTIELNKLEATNRQSENKVKQ